MPMRHYQTLPWIAVFVVALLVLAFVAWLGYDHWSDLVQ